jgi:3-hydroxyacyl-CoA dehydrogenase
MTAINSVVDLTLEGEIAILTVDNPPVNALSHAVREGLQTGVRQAGGDPAVKAVVLICAGRTFIAGADITEFGQPLLEPSLPALLQSFEDSLKPIIAVIHGTALGGGLETALASHWRVAVATAKLGLPEVKLGLLPGAGGTQRLPRVVGVEAALEMITSGAPIGAEAGLASGLIDEIVQGDLRAGGLAFARKVLAEGRPLRKVRDLEDKIASARGRPELFSAFRQANARRFRGFEAPEACIQAIEAAVNLPFDQGLEVERDLFVKLVGGDQSRAQRHVFFAERTAARIPDVPEDTPRLPIAAVGVLGAGTMGGGIAMNFLNAGIPVTLVEMRQEALDRGVATIRKNYESTAKRGRMTLEEVETRMGLLTPTLDFAALGQADLVIEAVFELMDVKKEVFARLDAVTKPDAILASNTSYLNIDEIASATRRPELVLGLHFFSPANVMRLLEVVRAQKTSKPVVATAMALGKTLGKLPVLVRVGHGFVGNRMLEPRQREANKLILEGALPWDVDRVIYDFGLPMGPFAMADLAGLDLGWRREESRGETIRDRLCELDRRGQKTGAGFYDYDAARNAKPSPVVEQLILEFSKAQGIERRVISDQEILERCLYTLVNEGAKILEEGIALRASDIDLVWINGYGWPVYRGGPMFWAELVGLKTIVERLEDYHRRLGDDFAISPLLARLAAEGEGFQG